MINSFSRFLVEEEKVVYFAFGRMNPPTIGHGKLMDKLSSVAGKNPYFLDLSQSHDGKDNPVDYNSKIKFIRKMFPKHARQVLLNKNVKTPFDTLSNLYNQGYRKVVMVAGSDRVDEYKIRLNKYNASKGSETSLCIEYIESSENQTHIVYTENVEGQKFVKKNRAKIILFKVFDKFMSFIKNKK